MKNFQDKVAVITGAASGIGRAIAERCAQEGMHVVLADVEEQALSQAENELKAAGASVLAVRTDVSKPGDVAALAQITLDTFHTIHLLVNNAGVGAGTLSTWDNSLADWEWVIGVNLWGVIHGLRTFIPILLAQDCEGHVVNTASVAGVFYNPCAPYMVTKHAVVALSEHLYFSLAARKAKVKASVLCPGWVNTRIMDSERNRPSEFRTPFTGKPGSPEEQAILADMRQAAQKGMNPQRVAELVFEAIRAEQFYIFTHPEFNPAVQRRMEAILQQRNPSYLE